MSSVALIYFTLLITFLPLLRDIPFRQTSHIWVEHASLFPVFLGVGLLFFMRSKSVQRTRIFFLSLSLVIVVAATVGAYKFNLPAVAILIAALGIILFFFRLLRKHGVAFVVVLGLLLGALHAQWGIAQFIFQNDLGLFLIGETRLFHGGEGIATFTYLDTKLVRAYGAFAHPNIFGGSLALALGAGAYLLSFTSRRIRDWLPWGMVGACLLLGIILSFSRVAYAMVALSALFLLPLLPRRVQRIGLVASGLIVLLFWPIVLARFNDTNDRAVVERTRGYVWARDIITQASPWHGFGVGNYTVGLTESLNVRNIPHEPWEIAPVHSVPLLLIAEWGVVWAAGLIALTAAGIRALWPHRPRSIVWLSILIPPLALDHYMLTQLPALVFTGIFLMILMAGRLEKQSRETYFRGEHRQLKPLP